MGKGDSRRPTTGVEEVGFQSNWERTFAKSTPKPDPDCEECHGFGKYLVNPKSAGLPMYADCFCVR